MSAHAKKPKRGRPRKGNELRDAMVALRVPSDLKARYLAACRGRGITLSDGLIRHMERTTRTHGEDARSS